jgi:hypothetical protein
MEAKRTTDNERQHCHIHLTNKPQINRKVVIANLEANLTKRDKQLSFLLEKKMVTM